MWFINKIKENKLPFIMLAIGMLLFTVLFLADRATDTKAEKEEAVIEETQQTAPEAGEYARKIEQKLESVLSCTAGVGKVNVVVSLEDYGEIYPFTEENSSSDGSKESDSAGGSRESSSEKGESGASVLKNSDGSESVVIRKSVAPNVKGVVVCAEGAESYAVQERIVRAVKAFCSIGIDCIEILPMGE
jgi:stage III sporulation protein AG